MGLPPTEREDASPAPERIGVYRIERRIGQGGMGEVFLAWDDRLERRVAIKRIRQDAGLSTEQRERFRREARLAARLSHSGVVQIHDLVTEGSEDAIVMEYVEGQTLAERLAASRLEIGEALRLAREVAEGLAAAHDAGLIHRDLKAANVVLTQAGHAKILDFGLARPVARSEEPPLTRQGFVIGTLQSMSPEQARGQEVDARSDLFSLGVLLYEMLTGRPPFRGEDAMDTLRRVVHEAPAEARTLRPDLPAEVDALLGRLLAKDRHDRPASAAEVVAALERIPASTAGGALSGTVSDLPTDAWPRWKKPVSVIQPRAEPLPSSMAGPAVRTGRRIWTVAALLALVAIVPTAVFLAGGWPSTAPLRIAVVPAEVFPANDEQLALAGSAIVTAMSSSLNGLEGLAPIDPREAARGGRFPVDIARVTAAQDVLTAEVRRQGELALVTLSRIQGSDGRALWNETFVVPMQAEELLTLANAVATRLRKAYPDHDLRPGVPELDVRNEDYAAFLEIAQRIERGAVPIEPELARLEEIVRSSPRFLEAQILAARLEHNLFLARREVSNLDRATRLVQEAHKLASHDPRPLRQELQIAFSSNHLEQARKILGDLQNLLPGDPEILHLQARLAEEEGRLDEAAALLSTAVKQAPSWQNLYRLAFLEGRRGRIDEARARIDTILQQKPDNAWALEALGGLELRYGDLARAEEIYSNLLRYAPQRSLANLGVVRFLRGRYQEAADAYRKVLAQEPNQAVILINLGDAEGELGRDREAKALYRRGLSRLAEIGESVGLTPEETMLKAHCLARLGRLREAVELAQAVLRKAPDDPKLLQQSSLVHSLAGERTSAINNAADALDKGLQPRWFTGSAFRELRKSPELSPRFPAAEEAAEEEEEAQ